MTGETPQINTTDYKVDGSVNRVQIENLPLNGRNFLGLSALEPGVSVTSFANPGALGNNFVRVSVAGAIFNQTRISVDGGTVNERITGGTGQNFSRRGGNDLHGTGFFYYRDHNMAAFPGFGRSASNPDPFFARRQSGFSLGGPFKKDRFFWFTNYEHNNQDGVFDVRNNNPIFSRFDRIHPSPLNFNLFNLRLDGQLTQKHNGYLRFSLDKNSSFAPPAAATFMPSNWQSSRNRWTQTQIGLTSALTPKLVNDLRVSYLFLKSYLTPPTQEECPDPVACIGLGGPQIAIFDAALFRIGNQNAVPTSRFPRTFQLTDNLTWQRGEHRLRFGGEWEHLYFRASLTSVEPAAITLWGVSNLQGQALRPIFDSLPASLRGASNSPPTLDEILQLPLRNFTTGIGNPVLPGPYNFDEASRNDRVRLYFQDAWRIHPRFTFNYGLAYSIETNLLNHDLDRPAYLAPAPGER